MDLLELVSRVPEVHTLISQKHYTQSELHSTETHALALLSASSRLRVPLARSARTPRHRSPRTPTSVYCEFHASPSNPAGLENYPFLTPCVEIKKANLYGASTRAFWPGFLTPLQAARATPVVYSARPIENVYYSTEIRRIRGAPD